jgi:hypothetical protein
MGLRTEFEVFIARYEGTEVARQVDKAEVLRRLGELNHAHERAEGVAHTYLTIDKYEAIQKAEATALQLALERQDGRLKTLENWRARATGAAVVLTLFAGLIGAAIMKAFGQ